MQQQRYNLFSLSLILLLVGLDCLPMERRSTDSSLQPPRCRQARPRSSDSLCTEKVRKWHLHESNPKGCKRFGICSKDAEVHDLSDEENYFQSFEECQMECMQHVPCPELPVVENLELVSDNGLQGWGRKVTHVCASGYSLADNSDKSVRTCQKNGTWSGITPVCLEQCHTPTSVSHAHIAPSKDRHNQGSTVHYTCQAGYNLNGSAQRTCGANGEWTGPEPSCVCKVTTATDECLICPELSPIENGQVSAPNRSINAAVEYTCNPGYILIGDLTRKCRESGMWSGEEPICWKLTIVSQESDGGVSKDITNATVTVLQEAKNHVITAISTPPNPFPDVEPTWTFRDELPFGVEANGFQLTFTTILKSQEQEGNYSITFGNYSASFQLETRAPPPTVIKASIRLFMHESSISVVPAGNQIKFIYVLQGCPTPDVTIYLNGKVVSNERLTFSQPGHGNSLTVGTVTLNGVDVEDTGEYQCYVRNIAGNDTSRPVRIEVTEPEVTEPVVTTEPAVIESTVVKRSIEDSVENSPCPSNSPDTVTLIGRVQRQVRQLRSSGPASYRVQVKRFLRGSGKDESLRRVRTIVFDTEPVASEEMLSTNTDYIFRGRLINKTLVVSRQNVQRHTAELENHINSC